MRGAIASDSNIPQNNATARKSPAPLLFFPIWYFLIRTFFGSRDMAFLRGSSSISAYSAPLACLGRVGAYRAVGRILLLAPLDSFVV